MNASSFRRLFLNQVLWQLSAIALLIGTVEGQQAAPAGTALIVGGTVVNVFESNTERLVQIMVQQSEVPDLDSIVDANYPAPGRSVYVHVRGDVPMQNDRVRAFLSLGPSGRWETAGRQWFIDDLGSPSIVKPKTSLGLTAEPVAIGRETALRVISVTDGGPAARAGFEPGDIIVRAGRSAISNEKQLLEAYENSRGELSITVRDVRSGRDVVVNVPSAMTTPADAEDAVANRPSLAPQPLGVEVELAFYSGQTAAKVIIVTPNGPAAKAGIKVGDLILKVNGAAISDVNTIEQTERNARGRMEMIVVDPKDRKERNVRVNLAG